MHVLAICIDFSKAFDKIDHKILKYINYDIISRHCITIYIVEMP